MSQIKLKYCIKDIKMESTHDERFQRVTIYAFADGENSHTHPISLSVLEKGSETIYDIPILCKYNPRFDDFEGHELDEIPIGFIKESTATYNNPVRFIEVEDGRTFLVIEGIIWTQYSKESFNVLSRDIKKSVSVELVCAGETVGSRVEVEDFILQGITILGDFVNPAVKGANLQLEFSKYNVAKQEYLKFAENSIKINNTKEASVNGQWSDPRRKLFNPISKASNSKALFNEAYLVKDFSTDEPEITKFKYPHHVIRNGELVVHERGLEAAFQRASGQGIVSGEIKEHLLRHYRELGLPTDNFSDGTKQFELEEGVGDTMDKKKELEMNKTEEEKKMESVPAAETNNGNVPAANVNGKNIPAAEVDTSKKFEDEEEDRDDEKETEEEMSKNPPEGKIVGDMCSPEMFEEMKTKMGEMEKELSSLKEANKAYMEQLEKMADYEKLSDFKKEMEDKIAKEKEMTKMSKVIDEIEGKGVILTDEEKDTLFAKFAESDSFEAWANMAKATVFDRTEKIGDLNRIGTPFADLPKKKTIWD